MVFNPSVKKSVWRKWVLQTLESLDKRFPAASIGTYNGHDPSIADAADFMIPNYASTAGKVFGSAIAKAIATTKFCKTSGIWYVIYWGRIWSMTRPEKGWLPYFDRNNANPSRSHHNHVHVSWYKNHAPAGWTDDPKPAPKPSAPVKPAAYTDGWVPDTPWIFYLDKQKVGITKSDSVWLIQKALGLKPYDGNYDTEITEAVKVWQREVAHNDPKYCDGMLGPNDAALLFGEHVEIEASSK